MNIYLKHPIHGAKVATMEQEAVYDEKSGWVRYNPINDELSIPVNELEVRRRGRPPRKDSES